jgi:predicted transglutaminase-like cysteine proteinase
MRYVRWGLMAACTLLVACQSNSLDTSGGSVRFGKSTGTPIGYYNLCKAGDAVCRATSGRGIERSVDGAVMLTAALRLQLSEVNRSVNQSIRPAADGIAIGGADDWDVEPSQGDCEDFALTKKSRLMKAGWPSSALLLAIVRTRSGEDHAVLVVRTTEGDVVLDNMTWRLRYWGQTGYSGKKIQSPDDEWRWLQVA